MTCKTRAKPIVYADRPSGMSLAMRNLFKIKQLIRPKYMLAIKFFLTDKIFPTVSPFEKSIVARICENPHPPKRAKKGFP